MKRGDLVAVVGARGMLGSELVAVLKAQNVRLLELTRDELDVTNELAVHRYLSRAKPGTVVNCTAYSDVAGAETQFVQAHAVNAMAPGFLAGAVSKYEGRLIHISSDYVFDGKSDKAYTEDDRAWPLNQYGVTKLEGEKRALGMNKDTTVLRVQWLYGPCAKSFPNKILARVKSGGSAQVVDDQFGCPTSTTFASRMITDIISRRHMRGLYHGAHDDFCSWYQFAKTFLVEKGFDAGVVRPIRSEEFSGGVTRPKRTVLDTTRFRRATGVTTLGSWKSDLVMSLGRF